MRIRTQMLLALALAIVLSVCAFGAMMKVARQEADAEATVITANRIAREAAGLLVLTQEYARYASDRAAHQWHARQQAIESAIASCGNSPCVKPPPADLRHSVDALKPLFQLLENDAKQPDSPLKARRQDILINQLLSNLQAINDQAYEWSNEVRSVHDAADGQSRIVSVAVPALLVLLIGGLAVLISRTVLKPLAMLHAATRRMRAGELATRTHSTSANEIGDLSREFDAMAEALQHEMEERRRSQSMLGAVTDNLPTLITYIDGELRFRYCNATYREWFHVNDEQLIGHTVREVLGEELFEQRREHLERALAGERQDFEQESELPSGKRWLHMVYVPDRDAQGRIAGLYGVAFDISTRKAAEQERAAGEHRLRTITDNLPVLIAYVDAQERILFVNSTVQPWMKLDPKVIIGQSLAEVMGSFLYTRFRPFIQRALQGERLQFDMPLKADNDQPRYTQVTYIPERRADGGVAGVYMMVTDVTALKLVEIQLIEAARLDSLTGLPNRRQFDEKLREAIDRSHRAKLGLSLLFLDIDHFKSINDRFGHGVGDQVLKEFGRRLRDAVRSTDTVARLAGDEFVVLLEHLHDPAEAEALAAKIVRSVRENFHIEGTPLIVTTSVGVAYADGNAPSPERLVECADKALYEAKAQGRNRHQLRVWSEAA